MGISMNMTECCVDIAAEKAAAAFDAIKAKWDYTKECDDLVEAIESFGLEVIEDENGLTIDGSQFDKAGEEEELFKVLAPFVEPDGVVTVCYEDSSWQQFTFKDGLMFVAYGEVTYDRPAPVAGQPGAESYKDSQAAEEKPDPDAVELYGALQWLVDDLTDADENENAETGEEYASCKNARLLLDKHRALVKHAAPARPTAAFPPLDPQATPNRVTLANLDWDVAGVANLYVVEGQSVVKGTTEILGVPHHVMFIEVKTNGSQEPVNDPDNCYEDVLRLNDGKLQFVRLPGLDGEWVMVVFPFAD